MKRLVPILLTLLSVLLDTAVLPVFLYGRYLIPISLAAVILIGIQRGRMSGMLYGLIAGLLLDVSAGTLGMKLLPYVLIGFLVGFFLDSQPQISRSLDQKERLQLYAVRAIWICVPVLLYEIVMLVYQYFSTAIFEWKYVRDLLARTLLTIGLCLLLYRPFYAMLVGKQDRGLHSRGTREVKRF